MSDITTPARAYRLTRPDGLGFFRRRSALQFAISCLGGGAMLLAVVVTGLGVIARTGLGVTGAMIVILGTGRTPMGEDLVDLFRPLVAYARRHSRSQRHWSAALLPVAGSALPPMFAGIELYSYEANPEARTGSGIGVVFDRADGSVSLVLRVHGDGFLLADASEQDARIATFGDALAAFARADGAVSRVSWSQFAAPAPIDDHLAYLASAEKAEPDEALRDAYLSLVRETARTAVHVEVLVTLTVGLDKVRARDSRGDRRVLAVERALDEVQLFSTELARAGLVPVGPLAVPALCRVLRDRLDPSARSHLDRRASSLACALRMVSPDNAFPLAVEERRDAVLTDGTWHRVFRVAEWPRTAVRADWLAGFLCEGRATRSFTVVFTPQSRRDARRQALAVATRVGANLDERERAGRRVGAEERRAAFAADALDEELEAGAGMELLIGLVDVTAPSPEELRVACDRVEQAAADAGMELRMVGLRQAEALVCSLPIGRVVLGKAR